MVTENSYECLSLSLSLSLSLLLLVLLLFLETIAQCRGLSRGCECSAFRYRQSQGEKRFKQIGGASAQSARGRLALETRSLIDKGAVARPQGKP